MPDNFPKFERNPDAGSPAQMIGGAILMLVAIYALLQAVT